MFITLLRPYRAGETPPKDVSVAKTDYGYRITAALREGSVVVGARTKDDVDMNVQGLHAQGAIAAVRYDANGKQLASLAAK
jgi:hypothetical protein